MKLMKHQLESVEFLAGSQTTFDMSDPGTGKTAVHITAFAGRRKRSGGKMLVLCPKSLMTSAWQNDIKKFTPHLLPIVASAKNRATALHAMQKLHTDILIANHDSAKILAELPTDYWKDFDTLVVDESDAYKNATAQRSKAVYKLRQHFTYVSLLSATPTANGVCDIWHQAKILDHGQRLGKNFFNFRAAVCTPEQIGMMNVFKWTDKPNAEAIVSALMQDIVIRHKFEDCVDIPPNHQYTVDFELAPKHQDIYEQMANDCLLTLRDDKTITAVNAAVLYSKLLQLASGAAYNTDGTYTLFNTDRYELVLDLAEQRTHAVVFFNWQHQKDLLVAEARKRKLNYGVYDGTTTDRERVEHVNRFQAGELRILFAHPQSAAHGLTLTKGTATIWASPTPNAAHYLQGLKRIHRIGQQLKTETIMVIAKNTLEGKVYKSLTNKTGRMANLMAFLEK